MPTTGRRRFLRVSARAVAVAVLVRALPGFAADQETPFDRLAKLATYLSENSVAEAVACFDSKMQDYSPIVADLRALGAQTDVLCAIDVVTESGTGDERKLDTDWFVELRSQAEGGPVERRRERVAVTMRRETDVWRITALSPISILAPIHI